MSLLTLGISVVLLSACAGPEPVSSSEASPAAEPAQGSALDAAFPVLTLPLDLDAERKDYTLLEGPARKELYPDTPEEAPILFAAVGRFVLPNGSTGYVVHETILVGGIVHNTSVRWKSGGGIESAPLAAYSYEACGTIVRTDATILDAKTVKKSSVRVRQTCGDEETREVTQHAYETWGWTGSTYEKSATEDPTMADKAARKAFEGQRLEASEVEGLACDDLVFVRNAPYAQHGYAFQDGELSARFEGFAGYVRDEAVNAQTVGGFMSDADRGNVEELLKVEKASGCK